MIPKLSIVIPSWNTCKLLRVCLDTIGKASKPSCEVIVVDNASGDGSADMVARDFPSVCLIRNDTNEGFAKGCNRGIAVATGELILLHNADTEVYPDALELMIEFLDSHPNHGAAAPQLVHADGSTQGGCMAFPGIWTPLFYGTPLERWMPNSRELRRYFLRDFDHKSDRDIEQPPAACLLVRRAVFQDVGLFDERLWLFFNDVDLSLRMAQASYKTRFVARAKVMHHVGASTRQFGGMHVEWQNNRLYYYRKHFGRIAGWWVKLCVVGTFVDFALAQFFKRMFQSAEAQPVRPVWAALRSFFVA